jgi:hypothetical protein
MKKYFFMMLILICETSFGNRFDPNNIDPNLFIVIKCDGISNMTLKNMNTTDTTNSKYQKFYIIDKESNLVLNYQPNKVEQFDILRGDWKITKNKVIGLIEQKSGGTSLISNFEYDISDRTFRENVVLSRVNESLTTRSSGQCVQLRSLPNLKQ